MNLFKPDKVMGLVSLRHRKADGKHVIDKYNVSIPSLKSVGSAIFDEDMSLLNAHSESTSWMRGAFSFDFKKESGVRRLSITGDSLDFKAINLKKQTHLTDLDISSQSIKPSQIINNSLLIEGDVSKVYLHNDVVLNMPLFKIQKVNDGLIHLSCSGHFDANDVVDINMNAPIINISTNNGGKLLKGLNISDKVRGGALIMSGELQDGRFQGKMTIDDYHMHKAPALAKLFSLISISSLEGLASLFDKGGIRFKKLDCPMNMYGGIISLDNCLASGPSLSMTASGYIDLNLQITEVHGTLAPENIISSTLRYVPILGNVLLSQKDQSLFGASYSIVGPIDDPKVSANPLSIFVPNRVKDAIVDSR
jgi:hypothetical protein